MVNRAPPLSRIALPQAPQQPGRREFPVLAVAAPVVGSLVMWAVTGSPFALVFAFLGPVVAVGSLFDARRHGRRSARAEAKRFSDGMEAVLARIASEHDSERGDLFSQALLPHDLLEGKARDPEWWRQDWDAPIRVCLGVGAVPSLLDVEPLTIGAGRELEEAHAAAVAAASTLSDAPVFVDARDGVGIVGPEVPAVALARSIATQLAFRLSPATSTVAADDDGCFGWARRFPHRTRTTPLSPRRLEFAQGPHDAEGPSARVVCVSPGDEPLLPRECRVLVRLDGGGRAALERNPSGATVDGFRPWFVSETQAELLVDRAVASAAADGLARAATPVPGSVSLSTIVAARPRTGRLPAVFSVGESGAVEVDLVSDGPHAVVGGTTGSGKSELLVSWVLAMAATCSPSEVNFLLVDFKGGASFAGVSGLPHTVGLITDLDQASAARALLSLQAELCHRERVLATAGVRSLGELDDDNRMPRLVILVDEFAVVVNDFPELQSLFADLAARGRSLGIHLVLCTQRPAGTIRDSVLANCALRMSLRVNNAADSQAVIGTPAAVDLPTQALGRCLISVGGEAPMTVQVALASGDDAETVSARYRDNPHPVRRPWCEPLPKILSLDEAATRYRGGGLVFGRSDIPESQSQPVAVYDSVRDGNLAVLGGHGAGKSGVLAVLQAAGELQRRPVVRIPPDVEGAWDAVTAAAGQLAPAGEAGALYLLDDLDAVVARFSGDHRPEFVELLARLLREGPTVQNHIVLSAARPSAGIQSLLSLCDSRLILRMPNRQEHLLAGGDGADFAPGLGAGAGFWQGHRVQAAMVPPIEPPQSKRSTWPMASGMPFCLVAAGVTAMVERVQSERREIDIVELDDHRDGAGPDLGKGPDIGTVPDTGTGLDVGPDARTRVLAGEVASWQSRWSLFGAMRAAGPVVFAGCSVAEFRSLTGIRQLPPPIGPEPGGGWILSRDGSVSRVQLPDWMTARR